MPSSEVDRAIAELARRQWGIVGRQQLIGLGLTSSATDRWVSRGRLHRVADGVYSVGHGRLSREGYWAAALLFAGPASCLSHRTAFYVWGIDSGTGRVEVIRNFNRSKPKRANTKDKWLTVHRSRHLPEIEMTRRRGFPVTTWARTMLDMTPRLDDIQLRNFLSASDRMGVADRSGIRLVLDRGPGWKGIERLRRAVEEWDPLVAVTKSNLESRFLALTRTYGIPTPELNVYVGEFEVDCFWRSERFIVELDTPRFHGDTLSFEKDHIRDLALEAAGFHVLRVTDVMLETREAAVRSTLADLLNRRTTRTGSEIARSAGNFTSSPSDG